MIFDATLQKECPHVVQIASTRKVLLKPEERTLIAQAQLAIRPAASKNYAAKAKKRKKINSKGEQVAEKSTWCNKPARILKLYAKNLERRPALRSELKRLDRLGNIAITKLIEHNYRLIISIAKKFQGRGLSWADLIQHGSDGFTHAVAIFDLTTTNKLSTCATQWIRQRISRAIENTSRAIRIPIHMQSIINEVKYIYRKYLERDEGAPSSEEIAQIYNLNSRNKKNFQPITKEEAEEVGRHMQDITSLNVAAGDDENLTVLDYIRDTCPSPEDDVEVSMDKQELNKLILSLSPEDQSFIKFKFGLVDGTPKSDAKAAQAFSIPIKQVREQEARILNELHSIAVPDKTNLDMELETFSVVLISAAEESYIRISSILGREIRVSPCKLWESTDRDQALILKARLETLGARVEIISSF